jgi:hypothetical protein
MRHYFIEIQTSVIKFEEVVTQFRNQILEFELDNWKTIKNPADYCPPVFGSRPGD